MTDVKLLKSFWNKGYGTEAMKAIAKFVFTRTKADLFLVPPHIENLPAIRVYEKSGFKKTRGLWYNYHLIYKMNENDFRKVMKKNKNPGG
jgi:RimJ/RimL family protein N-acetyltransferase